MESRGHFLLKASHDPCGYVKGSLRLPKVVVGTLGNVWDSCTESVIDGLGIAFLKGL